MYSGQSRWNWPPTRRPFPPYEQRQREQLHQADSTIEKGHGRIERRTLTATSRLNDPLDWPGLGQVCRIDRERTKHGTQTTEVAYCVTSLTPQRAGPAQLLAIARRHWGAIENGLHWVRDETLGEDRSTIASGHAPQNVAALRNTGLNWLRNEQTGNIAATLRSFTRNPLRLFHKLGYPN